MQPLVFVTQNKNKIVDAIKLLPEYTIEHVNFEIPEIQSFDIHEITEHKLKYAYEKLSKPCFVQDTGLFFDCLNGFPGPLIRWYFEVVGAKKITQITHLLHNPNCYWTTILGYNDGKDTRYIEESVNGIVPETPKGNNGYGWDSIFIPPGATKTFAEMTFEEKQSYAVTNKILDKFKELLINTPH